MSHRRTLAVAAFAVFALTGCGGGKAPGPQVASLPSAAAAGAAPSTGSAVPSDRPLIRRDTSQDELTRMNTAYAQCLIAHGATPVPHQSTKAQAAPGGPAATACANLEPEDYIDRLARTDPHYQDYQREWINCMRQKGLKVTPDGDRFDFDDDSQVQSGDALRIADECEASTFKDKN